MPPKQRSAQSDDFDVVENGAVKHTASLEPGTKGTVDLFGFNGEPQCVYRVGFSTRDNGSGELQNKNICSRAPVVVTDADLHFAAPPVAAPAQ